MSSCMAGFRRLCDHFCCVVGRMSQNSAEDAKFKRLRRLWVVVPVGQQGGKGRVHSTHAHE